MRNTVADLMKREGGKIEMPMGAGVINSESRLGEVRLLTLRLIIDPADCEIIDGKIVFEKRVLACTSMEAMGKSGLKVS